MAEEHLLLGRYLWGGGQSLPQSRLAVGIAAPSVGGRIEEVNDCLKQLDRAINEQIVGRTPPTVQYATDGDRTRTLVREFSADINQHRGELYEVEVVLQDI